MTRNLPEFYYQKYRGIWAVYRRLQLPGGGISSSKIESYALREEARREVFRLNGWKYTAPHTHF